MKRFLLLLITFLLVLGVTSLYAAGKQEAEKVQLNLSL